MKLTLAARGSKDAGFMQDLGGVLNAEYIILTEVQQWSGGAFNDLWCSLCLQNSGRRPSEQAGTFLMILPARHLIGGMRLVIQMCMIL